MKNKYKVLLVDDETLSLQTLKNALNDSSFYHETAMNGKEALEKLLAQPDQFAVVVLDRIMPYMSGMELLKIMQEDSLLSKIPVIMLTGLDEKEDIIDAVQAGVFDYLTKPADKALLIPLIEQAYHSFETLSL